MRVGAFRRGLRKLRRELTMMGEILGLGGDLCGGGELCRLRRRLRRLCAGFFEGKGALSMVDGLPWRTQIAKE